MVLRDAFQLFHTKTSKISQKLQCCIKSNYCFFTGLWMPADLRGTTASGQKSRLTATSHTMIHYTEQWRKKLHFHYNMLCFP